MRKLTFSAAALLALSVVALTMPGCHSDPHDTHVLSGLPAAR
jgi:hypothetical protein